MFSPGDSVKINPSVYEHGWDNASQIYRAFNHHNLIVDRVINTTGEGGDIKVVVRYNGTQMLLDPAYLISTPMPE